MYEVRRLPPKAERTWPARACRVAPSRSMAEKYRVSASGRSSRAVMIDW